MSLTSPALAILLAVISTGGLLAIVLGWRRLAGHGLRSVMLRVVSLVTLQACMLSLLFVTVNRAAEFYSSWSDLLGSDTAQGSVLASANVGKAAVRPAVVLSRTPVRVPGSAANGGTLDTVRFAGPLSGVTVTGRVYLPAGFGSAAQPARYPVIVVIAGSLADPGSPYDSSRLAANAAALIAARRLPPVVIAMLPTAITPADQGCLNVPAEPAGAGHAAQPAVQAATFYSQDLPAVLETQFRVRSTARSWALLGDSSGGYCALQLALSYSWVFTTAAAPQGAYARPPGPAEDGGSSLIARQEDLPWLLRSQPMQRISVLLTSTGSSEVSPVQALARRPMRVTTTTLDAGSTPLSGVLTWLGAAIGPARQGHPVASRGPAAGHAATRRGRTAGPQRRAA